MNAISMAEVKQKLSELEKYMPDAEEPVYEFGRFLSNYLNPKLCPQGFVMGCQLAIYDIQKRVNGFSQETILVLQGYPAVIYALLQMEIPRIAEAVCPEDFATKVKAFVEEISNAVENQGGN